MASRQTIALLREQRKVLSELIERLRSGGDFSCEEARDFEDATKRVERELRNIGPRTGRRRVMN